MNEDFEIASINSISSIHRKYFEDFIRSSIRLIINSRKKNFQNKNRTLSFSTEINDNQINNSSFLFEDLSFDSILSSSNSKLNSKNHIIDFYGIKQNYPKLLLERWTFSFFENNNFKSEIYAKKKLVSLVRSIYIISRILPCNSFKNLNDIIIDFQSYQNYKGEKFSFNTKEFHISNKNLNNINITVEYLSYEQMNNYFNKNYNFHNNDLIKTKQEKINRCYTLPFEKRNSFEILNFEEEKLIFNEKNFSKNLRKLSFDEQLKKKKTEYKNTKNNSFDLNNDLELIEFEDNDNLNNNNFNKSLSLIYKNLRAKNINEENNNLSSETKSSKDNIQSKRISRFKTCDTIDLNSSNSNIENINNNSFEFNFTSDKIKNDNVNKKNDIKRKNNQNVYKNVINKYFELKEKIVISKNEGFNINRLFCLINKDFH
jgi:hypothetical protein